MKSYLKLLYLIFYFSSLKASSVINNDCYVNINKKSLKNFLIKYTKNILLSIVFGSSIFGTFYYLKKKNQIFKGVFINLIQVFFWIDCLKVSRNEEQKNLKKKYLRDNSIESKSLLKLLNEVNNQESEVKSSKQNLAEIEENKAFLKLLKIIAR